MLTAEEVAGMRSTQEQAMPGTCVISRKTLASDGMGGYTETWAAAGTVTCRVMPATESGAERLIAERITEADAWIITLPYSTDVVAKDRVVEDSRTFDVIAPLPHDWITAKRVVCVEIG